MEFIAVLAPILLAVGISASDSANEQDKKTVEAVPKSELMPTRLDVVDCQATSADGKQECVIRIPSNTPEASIIRGKIVYQNYCVVCHGKEYDGQGRAAKIHNPRPTNLVVSGLPESFVRDIVRKGGEAVGRYKGMPPWGEQLTEEQLTDVHHFIMSLRNVK